MNAVVEVIRAIKIPAGSVLDGVTLTEDKWAAPGKHEIDAELMVEMEWEARGYVLPESIDGEKVYWGACCNGHP